MLLRDLRGVFRVSLIRTRCRTSLHYATLTRLDTSPCPLARHSTGVVAAQPSPRRSPRATHSQDVAASSQQAPPPTQEAGPEAVNASALEGLEGLQGDTTLSEAPSSGTVDDAAVGGTDASISSGEVKAEVKTKGEKKTRKQEKGKKENERKEKAKKDSKREKSTFLAAAGPGKPATGTSDAVQFAPATIHGPDTTTHKSDTATPGKGPAGPRKIAVAAAGAAAPAAGASSASRVYVFWDLDNKYPETLDHGALLSRMRAMLLQYGNVVQIRAYGNHRTLKYVPEEWDAAMRAGMKHPLRRDSSAAEEEEVVGCPLCGRRMRGGESELRTHFRSLHEPEMTKQLARLKGKERAKFVQSRKFERYQAAAAELLGKRRGYDLDRILRSHGVAVVAVGMGPQRADVRLQREAMELLERGTEKVAAAAAATAAEGSEAESRSSAEPDTAAAASAAAAAPAAGPVLVLVSDDHGFESLLGLYAKAGWRTATISETTFQNATSRLAWSELLTQGSPALQRSPP